MLHSGRPLLISTLILQLAIEGTYKIQVLANIDRFNYRGWHFITSFIDHAIQIYVGQNATENHRVMVLEEFLTLCITVSSDQYQKYKCFSCTQTILGPRYKGTMW